MAEIDLGQVRMADEELTDFILQLNGGVKLGRDANGQAGYVSTDETGTDIVIPFSTGGSSLSSGVELLETVATASTAECTKDINLNKDYKAILVVMTAYTTSGYPDITLELEKNSFDTEVFSAKFGDNAYTLQKIAVDVNPDKTAGDIYEIVYSAKSGGTRGIVKMGIFGIA